MSSLSHRFESWDSSQSLAEGLAEYSARNPGLKRGPALSPEARAFFTSHDVVHVVYGCGTSMSDEAIVKLASLFGTTGGLSVLRGYRLHESLDLYRRLPLAGTTTALIAAPYLVGRTIWRCSRQHAKWPWVGFEGYLQSPLRELRAAFGIRVAHGRRIPA